MNRPTDTSADNAPDDARAPFGEQLREATADWLQVIANLKAEGEAAGADPVAEGMQGLSLLTARSEEEAASACALLLREALETPGKTAALITPDPALARRVSARLCRWNVQADASQGTSLAGCPIGTLMADVAGLAADSCDPVRMLAVLKHPQVFLENWKGKTALERYALRGPRADWDGYRLRLREQAGPKEEGKAPPDFKLEQLAAAADPAAALAELRS